MYINVWGRRDTQACKRYSNFMNNPNNQCDFLVQLSVTLEYNVHQQLQFQYSRNYDPPKHRSLVLRRHAIYDTFLISPHRSLSRTPRS
jgi:hypothetical protein